MHFASISGKFNVKSLLKEHCTIHYMTLHLMIDSPYCDNASRPAAEAQVVIRKVQTFG